MLISLLHLVFAEFYLLLHLFNLSLLKLHVLVLLFFRLVDALDMSFEVLNSLTFVLKFSLETLVLESVFGDGLFLTELGGI